LYNIFHKKQFQRLQHYFTNMREPLELQLLLLLVHARSNPYTTNKSFLLGGVVEFSTIL
jgi:hypothetical protein